MSKKCSKCGKIKELSLFYKHRRAKDGLTNRCKECTKADVAAYREENVVKIREYDRRRYSIPYRREQSKKYRELLKKNDPGRIKEYYARYKQKNPVKMAARFLLNNAIRGGHIKRPLECSRCKHEGKIEAHHPDYYKPLDVEWVCLKCHKLIHKHKEIK